MTLVLDATDFARLEAVGLGCLLGAGVTLIHVTGLSAIVRWYSAKSTNLSQREEQPIKAALYFGIAIVLMIQLHIFDVFVWACLLSALKLVSDIHDAMYFAANAYTCLGYGDVPLSRDWRQLSPLIAISGLFTFACTTGQLFSVMGHHNKIVSELRSRRIRRNAAASTRG